jgi:Flp pilus assembly protein TadG
MVELASLVAIIGLPLLIGTAELATVIYDSIEISNSAHAGAIYGMQSSTYAANTSGITSAAQAEAADFGTSLSVTPTTYYACAANVSGTKYTGASAQSNAEAGCTGTNNRALEFVQVNTSLAVAPPMHLPGLPTSYTLTGSSVNEVEQ